MALVLAVEPDQRQAAILTRVIHERIRAELIVVDSRDAGIAALTARVPDVILLTALLSPRDEDEMVAHLRSLADADHVQTHTIPQLASAGAPVAAPLGSGGLLSKFRRKKETQQISGCDPAMFADEVQTFLARAAELKAHSKKTLIARAPQTDEPQHENFEAGPMADVQESSSSAWSSPFEWRRADAATESVEARAEAPQANRAPLVVATPIAVAAEEDEQHRADESRRARDRVKDQGAEKERRRAQAAAKAQRELEARAAAERERAEAEAAAQAERDRLEAVAAEKERARLEAVAAEKERERVRARADAAEKERLRLEAVAAEKERVRLEAIAAAERERVRAQAEAAEKERLRLAAVAAEKERVRLEAIAAAERERARVAEETRLRLAAEAAERERVRLEAIAAERERARLEAVAAAERERVRLEAEAAERERVRIEAAAVAERERIRLAEEERARLAAEAVALQEQRRLEAAAAAERERRKAEAEAAAEQERLRLRLEAEAAAKRERERMEAIAAAEREQRRIEAAAAQRARVRSEREQRAVEAAAAARAADPFAEFRIGPNDTPSLLRLMPLAFWARREPSAADRRLPAAGLMAAAPSPETPADELRDLMEGLSLPPHVAGVSYARGCRIRRVRVPASTTIPRVQGSRPLIVSKRALEQMRAEG